MTRKEIAVAITLFASVVALAYSHAAKAAASASALPKINAERLPDGIQPQTAVDSRGTLHMIYFKGDPSAGDIEYVTRQPGAPNFSAPIRVNSQSGSAIAIGTVRGPQMALGRDGRVFVVWMGSKQAKPSGPGGADPILFSRLNNQHSAFEPQHNLMQYATGINGGLSVAADQASADVYVMWHATGSTPGESNRRVYLARSTDDGATFARENPVSPAALGACGCCGMRGFVDDRSSLYILYRAAAKNIHRDMTLLISTDHGRTFRTTDLAQWQLDACPMTTNYISESDQHVFSAWETAGQVYFNEIDPRSFALSPVFAAPSPAPGPASAPTNDRKHPAVAANSRGQILLAWTEGTAWSKGGSLAWQLYDESGKPIAAEGRADGIPVWGLPSIVTGPSGDFTILY